MTTRGLRNNNPGNIDRHPDTKWQGAGDDQSGDPRFVVFKAPEWGIRAIAKLMMTYQQRYGCNTVRKIIGRWAPPSENNTAAYVAAVAAGCGVGPDDVIDVDNASIMLPLVKAIIVHENGLNPYPDGTVMEGLRLAGVVDAKPRPLVQQGTFQAHVGAGVAAAAAGATQVAQYAPTVKGWAEQLDGLTGSPIIQHVQTVLLTVAGGLLLLGIVAQVMKQRTL